MDELNSNDNEVRTSFSYGIDIGRELGEIESLLRDIRATRTCTTDFRHLVRALLRRTSKLLKEVKGLYYHVTP